MGDAPVLGRVMRDALVLGRVRVPGEAAVRTPGVLVASLGEYWASMRQWPSASRRTTAVAEP